MKNGYDQFFKKAQRVAAQENNQKSKGPTQMRQTSSASLDSKILAEQLRQRVKPKIQKKRRRPFPWKLVGASAIGLMVAALGMWKLDQIEKMAQKIEVSVMGTAYAEDTKASGAKDTKKGDAAKDDKAVAKDDKTAKTDEPKKEYTEEEINHFSKLNERKRELDAREEELNRMEQELQAQKAELDKRLADLQTTRRDISSVLEEKVQVDDKKVDNLVQMYSNMKPQQAAKAFEEMDEGLAIEILGRMKKKNAAEIMNLVKSEKVKTLSEQYAGYKRK